MTPDDSRQIAEGLSPRVRGNQRPAAEGDSDVRSIPACAGEPKSLTPADPSDGVYPRVCGGTSSNSCRLVVVNGLSPRVRGNRWPPSGRGCHSGSIPACAGEPQSPGSDMDDRRVYPRVCGGTYHAGRHRPSPYGLSPRVRGNQDGRIVLQKAHGSIPACAGEPTWAASAIRLAMVYPRVCGGTAETRSPWMLEAGLSPRVRGNQGKAARRACSKGSIPACAGEPCACRRWRRWCRVYPRVCGGTQDCGFGICHF